MSVQVAEEGNKRKGGMTSEETEQCILGMLISMSSGFGCHYLFAASCFEQIF